MNEKFHSNVKMCWNGNLLTLAHSNIDLSPQSRTNFNAVDSKLSVSVFNDAVAIVIIENKTQIFFILFGYLKKIVTFQWGKLIRHVIPSVVEDTWIFKHNV